MCKHQLSHNEPFGTRSVITDEVQLLGASLLYFRIFEIFVCKITLRETTNKSIPDSFKFILGQAIEE